MKHNRNQPCHCGSGKKFKDCHGRNTFSGSPSNQLALLLVAVITIVGAIAMFGGFQNDGQRTGTGMQAPPSSAPPGKVWSPEHGHWHDAPTQATGGTPSPHPAGEQGPYPQPPGPTPEGKVWSPEHGHWHDAPAQTSTSVPLQIQPPQGKNP